MNEERMGRMKEKGELKGIEICERGKEGSVNGGEIVGGKITSMLKTQECLKGLRK